MKLFKYFIRKNRVPFYMNLIVIIPIMKMHTWSVWIKEKKMSLFWLLELPIYLWLEYSKKYVPTSFLNYYQTTNTSLNMCILKGKKTSRMSIPHGTNAIFTVSHHMFSCHVWSNESLWLSKWINVLDFFSTFPRV